MSFSMLFNFLRSTTNKQGNTSSENVNNVKRLKKDPLEMVAEIDGEADQLESEVEKFNGEYQGKEYRYLDEMITRCMLKLDNIDSNGREDVRSARKTTLNRLDKCTQSLEIKATGKSNQSGNNKDGGGKDNGEEEEEEEEEESKD